MVQPCLSSAPPLPVLALLLTAAIARCCRASFGAAINAVLQRSAGRRHRLPSAEQGHSVHAHKFPTVTSVNAAIQASGSSFSTAGTPGKLSIRETGGCSSRCRDERRELGRVRCAFLTAVLQCLRCHGIASRAGERRVTEAMPLPRDKSHRLHPRRSPPSLPKSQARGVKLTDPFVSGELGTCCGLLS